MKQHEVAAWVSKATPDQIVERLVRAEREAFLWHVIETVGQMSSETKTEVTRLADLLVAGGYRRPEAQ